MNQPGSQSGPVVLKSERLEVEIAAPGSVYRGTRFDWSAFITQVTLDGRHTFCVPESYEPGQGTGGIGLCNEFNNDQPLGYDSAKAGEAFPKLGVGLLKRPDGADYNFFRPYEIVQPFPIHIEAAPAQARYVQEPLDCRGIALRLVKTLAVTGSQLTIAYELENVGKEAVSVNEYVHNFMGIDRQLIGPDYRLTFPYPVRFDPNSRRFPGADVLAVSGGELSLKQTPQGPFYCRPLGFSKTEAAQWELRHLPSGVGMREFDDFSPLRVAVWGVAHVISAEVFVEAHLLPGEKRAWKRRFEFFD